MAIAHSADVRDTARRRPASESVILPGVEVVREGRVERLLHARPTLSSAAVGWSGLAIEDYSVPACIISRHTHVENHLHVVVRGSAKYEVLTGGRTLRFAAIFCTTFILPRGTTDEMSW